MGSTKKLDMQTDDNKKHYAPFAKINGEHPFKAQVPEGRVEYQARVKKGGRVVFFHFDLAKEMGLIPKDHPNELNPELEKQILDTFSIQIINEWDIENKVQVPADEMKPNTYMATRYLQLQHPDKTGRTSGDGRTIWNGQIRHQGVTWDVSSCGTGGTKLSPAVNINKRYYQTGDPTISYGCGCSETGEGLETLFFSEVFHKNRVKTERLLATVEYDKGLAINVRAYRNLIRPSHFFNHLKQGNLKTLKQVADYYIERQVLNGDWEDVREKSPSEKYNYMLNQVAKTFASTAARFEDEYIFCWLDWDGDNILMDGGVIDYGSIRQFGLFHSEYRYDDVQRFSTTILEQRQKAKYIVQCFAQITDFLVKKKKRPLADFKNHSSLKKFDEVFETSKYENLMYKIGFKEKYSADLMKAHLNHLRVFRRAFTWFESAKSQKGVYKVADGITRDAVFCMRDILRELPQLYLTRGSLLEPLEFIEIIRSSYATKNDLRMTPMLKKQIQRFQVSYLNLVDLVAKLENKERHQILLDITMRSSVINKYDRVTGDSITYVVQKVGKSRPRLKSEEIFNLVSEFAHYQTLNPDLRKKISEDSGEDFPVRQKNILRDMAGIVRECREGL
ncbi:MAG: hypothetical protein K2P81_01550 [Bacteriovoracaceae bacterium]|nr:hypothetical protein [Bacteriovoracaceae bacterium]